MRLSVMADVDEAKAQVGYKAAVSRAADGLKRDVLRAGTRNGTVRSGVRDWLVVGSRLVAKVYGRSADEQEHADALADLLAHPTPGLELLGIGALGLRPFLERPAGPP